MFKKIILPLLALITLLPRAVFLRIFALALITLILPESTFATTDSSSIPQQAGIIQKLGDHIDLNLVFSDETGTKAPLKTLLDPSMPTVIAPVYYECPRLCTLTQEGLLSSIKKLDLLLGKEYQIISVSFNDRETSKLANERSKVYREALKSNNRGDPERWKFLVGDKEPVRSLMNQIGFNYEYDQGEYMHSAGLIIVSPDGLISRYLFGIEFPEHDLKLAIIEAGDGKVGSFFSKAMMFCFRYDHLQGKYTLAIWNLIRVVSIPFVILLAGILVGFRVRGGRIGKI
ncbi:MAG TPA: SCO family protein [Oligoflexia bacterium]|nr:SCO family protein [Oligoflexia bacterium]